MLDADRSQFDREIDLLFAALDKPLGDTKREAFWKGLKRMDAMAFSRCCDLIVTELAEGEAPRSFGVGAVWAAKRRLRAQAPSELPKDTWAGDGWDRVANLRLLAYIRGRLVEQLGAYGRGPSYMAMRTMTTPNADASPEFIAAVGRLVAYKRAWATDMREWGSLPSRLEQDQAWSACFDRAESEIATRQATSV
ncbi:MAG: hypothetical protein ACRETS_02800 [Steroidobacteraceae bacterium]